MRRSILILALGVVAWGDPVTGQEVTAGTRVRVAAPGLGQHSGLVLAATADSLLIGFSHLARGPIAIGRESVRTLELSEGGDAERGAAVGAQVGFAIGVTAWSVLHLISRKPAPRFHYDRGDLAAAALNGAIAGILSGAGIGALSRRERWVTAVWPEAVAAALPPSQERETLQTRVRLERFTLDEPIRVRAGNGIVVEGRYDGVSGTSLRVVTDSAYQLPLSTITRIEEQAPLTGQWLLRGAVSGAVLGLATVAFFAISDDGSCAASDSCYQPWAMVTAVMGFGGAFAGGSIGAIAGSYMKGWRNQQW